MWYWRLSPLWLRSILSSWTWSLVDCYKFFDIFGESFCFHRLGKLSNRIFGNFGKILLGYNLSHSKTIYFLERLMFRRCERDIFSLAAYNMLSQNVNVRHKSQSITWHLFSVYFTAFSIHTLHNISTIFRYHNLFSTKLMTFSYRFLVMRIGWTKMYTKLAQ